MSDRMHRPSAGQPDGLVDSVLDAARERLAMDPPPLDRARSPRDLAEAAGPAITADGIGADRALALFTDVLAPACLSMDHPRYLAFVPNAATEASTAFDLLVSASNIYGGSWLEGAGAVHAENEALRWLADVAGMPEGSGGTFVSGGSIANLSALAVARHTWRSRRPAGVPVLGADTAGRPVVVVSSGAHSSIGSALELLDLEPFVVPGDALGRFRPSELPDAVLDDLDAIADQVVAVVATGGMTNTGGVDDLAGAADLAARLGAWYHVDAAYGGGALCSTLRRHLFDGIERVDSMTVDPHKWLFAPYDCAAIVYREPELARHTFTQQAAYLDAVNAEGEWNPSDYAPHLSRRARGLPFWFSLATYGTDAYRDAVDRTIEVTVAAADVAREAEHLDLVMEPELSVLLVRRRGWSSQEHWDFCHRLAESEIGFIVPTTWLGETVLRYCLVNPATTPEDVTALFPPA
ncbi:pyridoxal phosphate-dependent decarboxylase family protein [Dermatobacter hominis]|uniref:pyridoxal phosphate-dependent decarboxylase family protein n=1 Tax=Dermatobacter hominis TaxID=2884263 RepID=UPI001D12884B|nr:pyridoxal-dependent decarboxylase [Dermatobacter hominis]UDY35894.1 aspartate aminotransferase family protein [Dermatobacter hominis]